MQVKLTTITFLGEYEYKDHFEVLHTFYKKSTKRRDQTIVKIMGIAAIVLSIHDLITNFNWLIFPLLILGVFYVLPSKYFLIFGAYINFLLSHPFRPIKYTINDQTVRYKNKLPGSKTIKWRSYSKYIYTDNIILLVRPAMVFPSILLITFIPKKIVKPEDWEKLLMYVKYREQLLLQKNQPRAVIRWSLRGIFIILSELDFWLGYIIYLNVIKFNFEQSNLPLMLPVFLLTLIIPFYSKWIDFKRNTLKRNILFPFTMFILFIILFCTLGIIQK